MAERYARCSKCKEFRYVSRLARLECPSCFYLSFRCKDCGGDDGALRSIRCHFNWFKSTRGGGAGGHVQKVYSTLARYVQEEASA